MGKKTVHTKGNEKDQGTVILACCRDSSKLTPMVIFEQKTFININNRHGKRMEGRRENAAASTNKQ